MATQHGLIALTFKDDDGILASTAQNFTFDDTQTLALVLADVAAFGALAAGVSNGGLVRQEVVIKVGLLGGVSATPTSDADAEEYGEWNLKNATTPYTQTFVVPCLKSSVIVGGKIDSTNTAVGNLEAGLTAALNNNSRAEGRDYHPFTAVKDTFRGDRSHRRARHAGSLDRR